MIDKKYCRYCDVELDQHIPHTANCGNEDCTACVAWISEPDVPPSQIYKYGLVYVRKTK